MNGIIELFKINLRIIYRDRPGLFWTLAVPVALYIALATLPIPNVAGGLVQYKNFALPGVIAYIVMQSGIYTLAYFMIELRSRGVIKRFLVTPIKKSDLVLSLVAARLTVILIQAILITLIGITLFRATFSGNIISTLALIVLGGGIFLLIGFLISNFSSSYQSAAPLTAAIGMPFVFLGNLFFPVELLPKTLQSIAKILPVTYLADGLRNAYLYAFSFSLVGKSLLVLLLWLIALLFLTIKVFRFKE